MFRHKFLLAVAILSVITANAAKYSYSFKQTNLAEALAAIAEQHPEIQLNFIYNEIDNYKTSALIHTDNTYEALRQTIGLNPVSIINKDNHYYIEALQHGKYNYSGKVIGDDGDPVVGASVRLLTPRDSTVITYGVTDSNGRFSIPCDKKNILAKFTCIGYKTTYVNKPDFAMGAVTMHRSPIRLSAISVEADNTVLSADKNVYIPTSTQKNASMDAADLLRRMAIPQLIINPGDNAVKDVFGNIVPVYINYHEARPDELKGMKMTDVRKIEYIEFPTDPRFKGEQRVVNFIVQEYEYGGYSKASESLRTVNGLFNNTDVFSRFTYKKMTYDIYGGSDNQDFHHDGSDNTAVIRLDDKEVTRRETFSDSHTRSNEYPLSFRASYYSPRFTARNTLSFTHSSSPEQYSSGNLNVNNNSRNVCTYSRKGTDRNNALFYNSNFWGMIGSNASFDVTPSFSHTHRDNTAAYESTLMQNGVHNVITENSYNWGLQANGRIGLGQNSQLSLFLAGGQNIFKLIYRGSSNADDSYSNSYFGGELRYRYQTRKIAVSSFLGLGINHNSMNGIITNDVFPRLGANAWFSINKRSQISAYISLQTTTPDISMKANDIVQSNEYIYLTGNPDLKNWRNFDSNVSYNLYFNNSLSLAAFAGYEQNFDRAATVYRPYNDGMALLRDYINNGSYKHYYVGFSINYKLFKNSLQLYANLTQNGYDTTGDYPDSFYPFRIQLQGVYYWKAFNILASWGNPQRTLTENSNYFIRGRNFHMFSIGWGNGTWTLNLAAKNIFNKGWHYETWEKRGPLYSEYRRTYSPYSHASITLSATYTIGYGKKVQRNNEAGRQGGAPSAIIK